MLLGTLSTGHQIGLGLSGVAFVLFALTSAVVIPRLRPEFPGRRLGVFVLVALLFFIGMIAAVTVFGGEAKQAARHAAPAAAAATTGPGSQTVQVREKEFRIALSPVNLSAGRIAFEVKNVGHVQHDLVIAGTSARTKLISPGQTQVLTAQLKAGGYEFYCSVPGHKQLGMDVKAQVR